MTDLLTTWQDWSYRNLLRSSLDRAAADGNAESAAVLRQALDREPAVPPLDALAANHELTSLLRGWQWHAIRAARESGAAWSQIAEALCTTPEQARAGYLQKIEAAERYYPELTDTAAYRAVLDDPPAAPRDELAGPARRSASVRPDAQARGPRR